MGQSESNNESIESNYESNSVKSWVEHVRIICRIAG